MAARFPFTLFPGLTALLLFSACAAWAQPPLVLSKAVNTYTLTGHLGVFQDMNGTARINTVTLPEFDSRFNTLDRRAFQPSDPLISTWFKFTLDFSKLPRRVKKDQYMIRFSWPFIHMIELYIQSENGQWQRKRSGIMYTDKHPYGPEKFIAMDLGMPPGSQATYYVRMVAGDRMPTTVEICSKGAVFTQARWKSLLEGIFYGILIAMTFYNLMMWFSLRQQAFIWYVLSMILLGVYFSGFNGLTYQFAPALMGPWFYPPRLLLFLSLSGVTMILFARSFLYTRTIAPLADKLLLVCMGLWILGALLIFTARLETTLIYSTLLGLLFSFVMAYTSLVCWLRGFKPALMVLVAVMFSSVGGVVFSLTMSGLLPYTATGFYGLQIGTAIEMVLFSLALAQGVRMLKKEKEQFRSGQEKYMTLSMEDPLTGLYNQRWLFDTLKKRVDHAQRSSDLLSVAMVDVDHFKHFNDTYGHPAGDRALKTVARILESCLRKDDAACRYGGEEFTLVLTGVDADGAFEVAERVRTTLEQTPLKIGKRTSVTITASIGVAVHEKGESPENLIKRADEALYTAKTKGRNQTLIAS
ncbi:MAG: GGDEF domain-containing protein [Desulfobacteraceae bacterium]|nr:MAG: GGDEF domain-containing protein [Desulfobacteraceae bacterium]